MKMLLKVSLLRLPENIFNIKVEKENKFGFETNSEQNNEETVSSPTSNLINHETCYEEEIKETHGSLICKAAAATLESNEAEREQDKAGQRLFY